MPRENELVTDLREGVEALRAGRPLRVTRVSIKAPPEYTGAQIAKIRAKTLQVSQRVFAKYLGVSASAVRSWEQKQRKPSAMACRLIQIAAQRPQALRELVEA